MYLTSFPTFPTVRSKSSRFTGSPVRGSLITNARLQCIKISVTAFKKLRDPRLPDSRNQGTLTSVLRNIDNDQTDDDRKII